MRYSWIWLVLLLVVSPVSAANHYIRAGSSGDGSDWSRAWGSLQSVTWTRGDTYYIAAGNYLSTTVTSSDNGVWLHIRKATVADHGTDIGWNGLYASGQAVLVGTMTFYGGHIDFDGVTGSNNSGHGIKIDCSGLTSGGCLVMGVGQSYVSWKHLEVVGGGANLCLNQAALHSNSVTSTATNMTFSYNYIHDFGTNGITLTNHRGVLIEHNYFAHIQNPAGCGYHGQIIQITQSCRRTAHLLHTSDRTIRRKTYNRAGNREILPSMLFGDTPWFAALILFPYAP
jgi:hypothetical protein